MEFDYISVPNYIKAKNKFLKNSSTNNIQDISRVLTTNNSNSLLKGIDKISYNQDRHNPLLLNRGTSSSVDNLSSGARRNGKQLHYRNIEKKTSVVTFEMDKRSKHNKSSWKQNNRFKTSSSNFVSILCNDIYNYIYDIYDIYIYI